MRAPFRTALAEPGVILCDGATGTLLHARDLPGGRLPEAWNLENPAAVQQVPRDYAAAGARLVTTNTLGGTHFRLQDAGLAERVREVNRIAAELACAAVGDDAWVAGSVGPTGQLLAPYGGLTLAEAEAAFAEQIAGLIAGGVDALLIETHIALEEVLCALRAARAQTDLPVLCTLAFDARGRTVMGLKAEVAARELEAAGADVVGANCGAGPEAVRLAIERMRPATRLPLMAKANAGIPRLEGAHATVWDVTPEQMAAHARALAACGAKLIGGCCGTTPEFIQSMRAALADMGSAAIRSHDGG